MVTKEINEQAQLWFNNVEIRTNKVNGIPVGLVVANGGFILPSTGIMIQSVGVSEDVSTFLGTLAAKLSLEPMVVYQAICDSLEDAYNISMIILSDPVVPPEEPIVP